MSYLMRCGGNKSSQTEAEIVAIEPGFLVAENGTNADPLLIRSDPEYKIPIGRWIEVFFADGHEGITVCRYLSLEHLFENIRRVKLYAVLVDAFGAVGDPVIGIGFLYTGF